MLMFLVTARIHLLGVAMEELVVISGKGGTGKTTVATNLLASIPFFGADGPGALVSANHDLRVALLGGAAVSGATLNRFYVLHCLVLPMLGGGLMALHFWRVRKDGISKPL